MLRSFAILVVSVLVSRHLSRALGKKIASRVRLSPVVMESTHDLDFVMWLLEPAKPVGSIRRAPMATWNRSMGRTT